MSINKVILLGNVGKDPEVRYVDNNVGVATFPLATSERAYTLQNGTQVPERTEWHNLVLWRGLAEIAEKYIHKGDKLYVEGKIKTRSYDDQSGAKRYITEIYVENMEMLTPKSSQQGAAYAPPVQNAPSATQAQQTTPASPTAESNPIDDLPF